MMNHFFALLIILGVIFGLYTATREAAQLTEADVRRARWEALKKQTLEEIEKQGEATATTTDSSAAPTALPQVDEHLAVITYPDGTRVTQDSIVVTSAEMRKARWERLKGIGATLTRAAVDAPTLAVTLCIEYIGLMALWLGIMRVAERAGLIQMLARALAPVMCRIFPGVPSNHPAMSAMLMNMSANMLGLDNAATPLGLAAMRELQKLNRVKDTASNAMVMFLAINTSSLMILPFTIVGFRVAAGSMNPQAFLVPAILATACSTLAAIILTPFFARFSPYPKEPEENGPSPPGEGDAPAPSSSEPPAADAAQSSDSPSRETSS